MTALAVKPMHLPWHQAEHYWLCILPREGSLPSAAVQRLTTLGMELIDHGAALAYAMRAPRAWGPHWQAISQALKECGVEAIAEAAVLASETRPDIAEIAMARRTCAEIESIAESLWLGDALLDNALVCYFQPVVSGRDENGRDKIFGYESFMRARAADGKLIAGAQIVQAARALSLQFAVDRHMHVQAVKAFVSSHLTGSLFINFIPGFIQRPEVYLDGLIEAVRAYGLVPRQIVLDVTESESPHDVLHIRRIAEYCHGKGYAVALDDVESVQTARNFLEAVVPEFVKLDRALVNKVNTVAGHDMVRSLVEVCHARGSMVLAEGVETDEIYRALKGLGVDLFQGYFFAPPRPVEELVAKV